MVITVGILLITLLLNLQVGLRVEGTRGRYLRASGVWGFGDWTSGCRESLYICFHHQNQYSRYITLSCLDSAGSKM